MIIIGDVHGNFDTLMALLDKIPQEEKDKGICLVGDLVDRGPKSMQVVDWVMKNKIDCVTGNHEILMRESVPDKIDTIRSEGRVYTGRLSDPDIWMINGGLETLHSYMAKKPDDTDRYKIPQNRIKIKKLKQHITWMESLPLYKEYPDVKNEEGRHLVVTHSAIGKAWQWNDKRRQELKREFVNQIVWSRPHKFVDNRGIYNVFGHTPISNGPRLKSFYANIDTGCFYPHREYFQLTALQFPEMIVYSQECIDKPVYKIF